MHRKRRSDDANAFLRDPQRRGHHSQSAVELAEMRGEPFVAAVNGAGDDGDLGTVGEWVATGMFVVDDSIA